MALMDLSINNFTAELASSSPAPGGGTLAAINGAFAASLGEMVCALTLQRPTHAGAAEILPSLYQSLTKARKRLLLLADKDTQAFMQVMAAFRLPKETDEEKSARREKIAAANIAATRVPMETAEQAVLVCGLLEQLAGYVNDNVLSDCGVGIECARTAALGAFMNVSINLPGIKAEKTLAELETQLDALKGSFGLLYNGASQKLGSRFSY